MIAEKIGLARLSNVKCGQSARVESFNDEELSLKLLEMGCLPGVIVTIDQVAPLGCPVCIRFNNNNQLALRKSEADTVTVTLV